MSPRTVTNEPITDPGVFKRFWAKVQVAAPVALAEGRAA